MHETLVILLAGLSSRHIGANKPGCDPVELFVDPAIRFPRLAIRRRLARRTLGCATLMDIVPLDATLMRGSHGRVTDHVADGSVFCIARRLPHADGPATTAVKQSLRLKIARDKIDPAIAMQSTVCYC